MPCLSKAELYQCVDAFRQQVGLDKVYKNIHFVRWCRNSGFARVEEVPFRTRALRGMAYLADNPDESNVILLNKSRSNYEQTFYCAHEMIHIGLHSNEQIHTFQCFDQPCQNDFLEWQANQGGAELTLPYRDFLPLIRANFPAITDPSFYRLFRFNVADRFRTTESVVQLRFEDMKYEIAQYLNGTPLSRLEFLSARQLQRRGISVPSITDLAFRDRPNAANWIPAQHTLDVYGSWEDFEDFETKSL